MSRVPIQKHEVYLPFFHEGGESWVDLVLLFPLPLPVPLGLSSRASSTADAGEEEE